MDDTLRGALRAVNVNSVDSTTVPNDVLVRFLVAATNVLERIADAEHLFAAPADPSRDRRDKESQAIVLAHTMKNPNLNAIGKALGIPRSTLRRWKHLEEALEKKNGTVREPRRGRVDRAGQVESETD